MSDQGTQPAAEPVAGANGAVDGTQSADYEDKTLLNGDDAGNDDGGAPQTWPEDWRERLAGEDAKALSELKRFGSVDGLYKKLVNQEKLIRTSRSAASLPEDPSPEEIAAYRKSAGVPEAPEGYAIEFPAELKASDGEKAALAAILAKTHAKHVPAAHTQAVIGAYMELAAEAREARDEFVRNAEAEARAELRAEWGRGEFKRNLTLRDEFLEKHMGDRVDSLTGLFLADGRPLGKHPDFNRFVVAAARAVADEGALIGGDGEGGGKSIDDEYDELITENAKKALTGTKEARLEQLADARRKRDAKRAA